jgi:hypothetical protein
MLIASTPDEVSTYRFLVIRSAIKMYVKHGMRPNRSYTPAAMAAVASEYTGKMYKGTKKGLSVAFVDLGGNPADL